ncbi:ABC transporter permease [Komagataeibacter rhaeticus]|uniref:ABC transporter permease n=1 Tax=Komagataeibacter rhaeticus TaxID=215221 RepID=UPI0002080211|nr:ABC transporter permease [Komagataeibacter rhaeticus]ATU71936.1 ABC transporter permease [Komagataeibacter xylinus]EGG75656.1 Putative aliphatic sulfonates transport permease protein ssuC [Gluconacetobacter sp. SXCC-1]KDU95774.1 nitrate ABC transporter permease [Komagataeibacter rhaeticus AF1]MBL7239980.1 ABC transporter permease [Komagataeibacter rhaeticus]PYD54641.1 ABC transporter permease [Komagataeibacter rhaeticus]
MITPRPVLLRPILGAAGLVVLFGVWEASIRLGWVPSGLLPAPTSLGPAWLEEVRSGAWTQAIRDSLTHYLTGLLAGSVLGTLLGLLCGAVPLLDGLLSGVVRVLRPIPGLAWVPFAILWFGLNTAGATFVIAISVFWINFYAAYGAVQSIDPDLYEVAASFGHGGFWARLRTVVIPASAPGVLAGLRTGLGQAWMSVVAAELFGVPGIGARMMQASSLLATDLVVVYMLTMALLYALTDTLFMLVRKRLLGWQG